jgi:hypothetical protein
MLIAILAIANMTKDTLIKHMEVVVICEERGSAIANYNTLIIQPKVLLGYTTHYHLYNF